MDRRYTQPWRLASDCPLCGSPLRLRRRRGDAGLFLGCAAFPSCRFAEDFDLAAAALLERIAELEAERDEVVAALASKTPPIDVARELRGLIYRWHPDRCRAPINPNEIVSELTALRARCAA